jgi:molecular chaperone GrpE
MDENEAGAPAAEPAGDGATDRSAAEIADLKDRLLRALADQENLRRRAARDREDAVRFAAADLIRDLLPSVDNLRRAIESISEQQVAEDEALRNLLVGVTASERALLDALEKNGIRRIAPAPGEPFDPHLQEAMLEVDISDLPPGSVAQVIQPGYAYHDRLLRPALVGVTRGAPKVRGETAGESRSGNAAGND